MRFKVKGTNKIGYDVDWFRCKCCAKPNCPKCRVTLRFNDTTEKTYYYKDVIGLKLSNEVKYGY